MGIENEELVDQATLAALDPSQNAPTAGEAAPAPTGTDEEDDRVVHAEDDDEQPDSLAHDQELVGKSEAEREEIRARRREERRLKKERAREREDDLRRELNATKESNAELRARLDQIDRRNHGFDLANLDAQMQQLNSSYMEEQQRIADAATKQDGATVAQATNRMLEIREQFNRLAGTRQAIEQGQKAPRALDPRLLKHANDWREKNAWYDPDGRDEDSRIALVVDHQLSQDGFSPNTAEYWQELDTRLKKRLPHRFERGTMASRSKPSGAPVGGSSRSSGVGGGQSGVPSLSNDRIDAIKKAGLWNDPKKREAAIANYKSYDAEHQGE